MSVSRAVVRAGVPLAAALFVAGITIPAAWAAPGPPPGPHPGPKPAPANVHGNDCTRNHGRIVFDDPHNTRGPQHCQGGSFNGRRIG
jgi:hypothetical protein